MTEPVQPALPPAAAARVAFLNRLVPDTKTLLVLALVAIIWKVLDMIQHQPALLKDPAFMTFVGIFAGGSGIAAAVAHYFGGTKAGTDVMSAQSDALIKGQKSDGAQ